MALVTAIQLLAPASANAISSNPLNWLGEGLSALTGGLAGTLGGAAGNLIGNLAVKGVVAVLNAFFSGIEAHITLQILTWLTSSDNQTSGHIDALYGLTSGIALGLLGAVLTVAFLRYWLAGLSLSGRGGFEAVEGLLRTLAAVAGLLVWPFVFNQLVALGNILSATILGDRALRGEVADTINTVVFVTFKPNGPIGLFIAVVLAVAGALLFLGLLFMKVMTGAALTFLYVAMPIAIILWPVEELAWLSRHAARTFFALVLIPVVWALIFATFAAISVNALEFQGASGFVNQITQPLVAIAMLWLTVTIPRTLFKLASSGVGLTRHGGGFLSHAGSFLAARQAGAFLGDHGLLPFGPGGFMRGDDAAAEGEVVGAVAAKSPAIDGVWMSTRDDDATARPSPSGSDGSGAEHAGKFVEELAASAAGPAGAVAEAAIVAGEAASTATDPNLGDVAQPQDPALEQDSAPGSPAAPGAQAESDLSTVNDAASAAPPGHVEAEQPSIGPYRPERDIANPLAARPADTAATRPALTAALARVGEMPPPKIEQAHHAFAGLHPDLQQRMREAWDSGGENGAAAVRLEAARRATSDQISNAQAADLLMVARAAEHGMVHTLLGVEPPAPPASSAAQPPPLSQPPGSARPAPPTPDPGASPESPVAAERDTAVRRAGPSVQPHPPTEE